MRTGKPERTEIKELLGLFWRLWKLYFAFSHRLTIFLTKIPRTFIRVRGNIEVMAILGSPAYSAFSNHPTKTYWLVAPILLWPQYCCALASLTENLDSRTELILHLLVNFAAHWDSSFFLFFMFSLFFSPNFFTSLTIHGVLPMSTISGLDDLGVYFHMKPGRSGIWK